MIGKRIEGESCTQMNPKVTCFATSASLTSWRVLGQACRSLNEEACTACPRTEHPCFFCATRHSGTWGKSSLKVGIFNLAPNWRVCHEIKPLSATWEQDNPELLCMTSILLSRILSLASLKYHAALPTMDSITCE